jgi:hypothetical protein
VPGIPLVFTGDEFGAKYSPYDDTKPISFSDHYGLRPWYRQLIALKEGLSALHSANWEDVDSGGAHAYAFIRWGGPRDAPILVVLNFGAADVLHVKLKKVGIKLLARRRLADRLSNRRVQVPANGRFTLRMPAYGASVFLPTS